MPHFVITANDVRSGRCVWLNRDGSWSSQLDMVEPLDDEAARDQALTLAKADQARVCDPYAIEVQRDGSTTVACSLRERIRAQGPTV